MITITGMDFSPDTLINEYKANSIERKILDKLSSSSKVYRFNSLKELKFELTLRINIISAARELNKSKIAFRTFRRSMCNENYWVRTDAGGFILKEGVKPADAIKDIFINGSKYGTECATAMIIIFYKAVLSVFGDNAFNSLFTSIELMNWHNLDDKMDIQSYRDVKDFFPGDCRYFKNPDVDPLKPEWQGENAIDLGDGTYYGHGVNIKNEEQIIGVLNRLRKKGATESAYLTDSATYLGFKYLAYLYSKNVSQ